MAPAQLGKWLVLFCDEINLPDLDKYGTQRVILFLRQIVEHGGFYRTSDHTWVTIERIQFVGACNPPTDPGRKPLSHRIQTYRKVAPMKNHGRDIYTSTLRYYRNAFTDADKQMAINVFLGVFVPKEGEANVWELSTDYYLHHRTAREPQSPKQFKSPTKWWKDELISSLPLPQYEGQVIASIEDDPEEEEGPTPPAVPHINNDNTERDSFDEIYKTYELTDFDRLLSTSVVRTGDNVVSLDSEGAIQGNPFVVRDKMKKKVGSSSSKMAAKRGFSVGIPQTEPAEADEYSSDSDPEDERTGDQYSPKQQDSNVHTNTHSFTSYCTPNGLPSSIEYYGFECRDPSKEDMKTYERFDRLYQLSCIPLEPQTDKDLTLTAKKVQEEKLLWKPTSHYSMDNSFQITPPTVSEENKRIYDEYCKVARYGPRPISDDDIAMYSQFDR